MERCAPTDDNVGSAATRFRAALDEVERQHWARIYIQNFPSGSCGHCSELLALYLSERFDIALEYVCKLAVNTQDLSASHAWLEWNGLIIDITGDQFGWPPVIVSRTSEVHSAGTEETRYPWVFDAGFWSQHCSIIWPEVVKALEKVG